MRYYLIFKNIKTGKLLQKHFQFKDKKEQRLALEKFRRAYPVTRYLYIISVALIVFKKKRKSRV